MPMDLKRIKKKNLEERTEEYWEIKPRDFIPAVGYAKYAVRCALGLADDQIYADYKGESRRINKALINFSCRLGILAVVHAGIYRRIIEEVIKYLLRE